MFAPSSSYEMIHAVDSSRVLRARPFLSAVAGSFLLAGRTRRLPRGPPAGPVSRAVVCAGLPVA